jgi:hypothetical protein
MFFISSPSNCNSFLFCLIYFSSSSYYVFRSA